MRTVLLCLALSTPAFADEADKAACEGLAEGDDCTRGDGDAGTCQLDADDDVLSCDDDAASAGDDSASAGCATVGANPSLALLLAAAAGLRRRARR